MKLYRYRPLNGFLFKELKYREVYLASYEELNDPQDLSCSLNYYSLDEDHINALVHFIIRRLPYAHGMHNFALLKDLFYDSLGVFLLKNFSSIKTNVVSENDLRGIMSEFYTNHINVDTAPFHTPSVFELFDSISNVTDVFLKNSSVACFSESFDNFLMWSHYSGGHSGVCLEFEMEPISTEDDGRTQCGMTTTFDMMYKGKPIDFTTQVDKVQYGSDVPSVCFYDYYNIFINIGDTDLMNLAKSRWHAYANEIKRTFTWKLDPWSEEKEWRIVNVEFRPSMPEDRILKYPSEVLKAIYFGANMNTFNQLRIANIVGSAVTYHKCHLNGTKRLDTCEVDIEELKDNPCTNMLIN